MTIVFLFLYNILFFLALIIILPFSLFIKKIRSPYWKRFLVNLKVKKWRHENKQSKVISFHCASYGEYEHIKPFIKELKEQKKDVKICVQFFSPSGYKNVTDDDYIDLKVYTPFDNIFSQQIFFKLLKPQLHIFAKYDVWPNEIYSLKLLKIKTILINASLSENSKRFTRFKYFHEQIYRQFDYIYTVSVKDAKRFKRYFGISENVKTLGDTKNDQVLYRSEQAIKNSLFPLMDKKNDIILVAGSIWKEDWEKIGACVHQLLKEFENFKVVLCPHELKKEFIESLQNHLAAFNPVSYNNIEVNSLKSFPKVMIIDAIGKLADLYSYGNIAFVGGSFKGKVHNVLEPAIYGIPVLTGPFIKNSSEALQLKNSGLIEINEENNLCSTFKDLISNKDKMELTGKEAKEHVMENLGISKKLCKEFSTMNLL
ncbi:MAG: hypothetical protein KAR38_15125 [Calditrichia bacterium]|nr:hypothetical protein [Calditrichia bacterium]